jgi:rhamnosyltransferase
LNECKISVIIPVKNGVATLERCLQSIADQTIANNTEIIILNSMSTDNSMDIARKFNARIIDIPEGTFDHGLTRNIGVQQASGEFVYLTVQDAWMGSGPPGYSA